ncbi:MAG: hypothetical protein E7632_03445 [Ruminococcaceae bacterium]|nr:hypothetical protein [Oscillospiraceae bacterium]
MKLRGLCWILVVVLMLGMAACGTERPELSRVTNVYDSVKIPLPENVEIGGVYPADGELILHCLTDGQPVLYRYDPASGELSGETLPAYNSETTVLMGIAPIPDGTALLIGSVDMETMTVVCRMELLKDGEISLLCEDVMAKFPVTFGPGAYAELFAADRAGNLYFPMDGTIFVFDSQMNYRFELDLPGRLNELKTGADGCVYVRYRNQTGGTPICPIDPEKESLGAEISLPESFGALMNPKLYTGPDFSLYVNAGGVVYGWNDGEEAVPLLDFVNSDLIPGAVQELVILGRDSFIMHYAEDGADGLYLLKRVPDEDVPARYIIEVAAKSTSIAGDAVRFNRQSDTYRVSIRNYGVYNTPENGERAEEMLALDIASGNAPDMILLREFNNRPALLDEVEFADLYEYLDKDDTLTREMLFDSVLTGYETDGELPELVIDFMVDTLAGKRGNLPAAKWSAAEFLDFAEKLPDGTFPMTNLNQMTMLHTILGGSWSEFVDTEAGKCSFDSELFRRILSYCKSLPNTHYRQTLSGDALADYQADTNRVLRDGTIALDDAILPGGVSNYLAAMAAFGFDDVCFIGYPTAGEDNGARISPMTSAGILAASPVKDGAWEFLRMLVTECDVRGSYPAYLPAFDKQAAEDMEMHWFFRYDGGVSGGTGESFLMRYSENQGIYRDITEADVTALRTLIDGASALSAYAEVLAEMINEEVQMYFSGSKSLDETVKVIDGRCAAYLGERS